MPVLLERGYAPLYISKQTRIVTMVTVVGRVQGLDTLGIFTSKYPPSPHHNNAFLITPALSQWIVLCKLAPQVLFYRLCMDHCFLDPFFTN